MTMRPTCLLLLYALATGCGGGGSTPVFPTPTTPTAPTPPPSAALHDTLVPTGSSILNGTGAVGSQSAYSAPFDDFIPATNATIRSVEWQGYYCNTAFTGNAIPDPVATGFIIRLAPNEEGAQRPSFDGMRVSETC